MTNGGVGVCVDYCALNKATVKNHYPIPLFSAVLDCVCSGRIFVKLDLHSASNRTWIREGDECRTAVRKHNRQFEYEVLPLSLTNTPASFQSCIDDGQQPYIDDFTVCYLNDILIYSANGKEHEEHVHQVLQHLKEFSLYWKAKKCHFEVSKVGCSWFVITSNGVSMESGRISTNGRLTDTNIDYKHPGAARMNEPLRKVRSELCQGDPPTDVISKESRDKLERQERDTSSQFLLLEALFSQAELWHLWSGVIGHHGNTNTVALLPPGWQWQDFNSAWTQES